MHITIRFRGLEKSEALEALVTRRLKLGLERFSREVTDAFLQLADINGPKGGLDKQCRLTLRGPRLGEITLKQLSGDCASAVDLSCEAAKRCIARELQLLHGRRRSQRRGPDRTFVRLLSELSL